MSERKYWKTTIVVEVLSEDEPVSDERELESIGREIINGDWSGHCEIKERKELSGKEAADALREQGSDPSFFNLDEDGNELD